VQELVSSLARFSRVVWFDMRGVGLSDRVPESAVAAEDWMEDVAAVMDAAGSERASLIAHGHAAQMALMAAATHPDRTESLVLINGFARFARADDYLPGIPSAAASAALDQLVETWGKGTMASALGPSVASSPGMSDWYGRLERFSASPGTALARMRTILELDVPEHGCSSARAPTTGPSRSRISSSRSRSSSPARGSRSLTSTASSPPSSSSTWSARRST
jgi:pimeloyl-ACP methyl ester carboxylesterase